MFACVSAHMLVVIIKWAENMFKARLTKKRLDWIL